MMNAGLGFIAGILFGMLLSLNSYLRGGEFAYTRLCNDAKWETPLCKQEADRRLGKEKKL